MSVIQTSVAALKLIEEAVDNKECPLQWLYLIFALCESSGALSMSELHKRSGVSQPAVSRNCSILGRGLPGSKGRGIVETFEDPDYRRQKLVRLTPEGESLRRKLLALG